MKQKKFGKKIQNWHRPLGPSQRGYRFRRLQLRNFSLESIWDEYRDVNWDPYDPIDQYDPNVYGSFEEIKEDYHVFLLNQLIEDVINSVKQYYPDKRRTVQQLDEFDSYPTPSLTVKQPTLGIEERLAKYIDVLKKISATSVFEAIRYQLFQLLIDWDSVFVRGFDNTRRFGLTEKVCLFTPFWLSSPQTWNKNIRTQWLNHIFAHYPVPPFLYKEWFRQDVRIRLKWLSWFIIIGQGGSLQRASKLFKWLVPSKFQHYLMDVPSDASPVEACIYAEVMRLGGNEIDFRRIHQNQAFIIDPTEPSSVETHSSFWQQTVRWLIRHRDEITDDESFLILAWAMREYMVAENDGLRPFSWRGRTVRSVVERSIEYHRWKENTWYDYRWQSNHFDWTPEDPSWEGWSFIELTTGPALYREGQALHHCVINYAARCVAGHSAIVSMRYQGESQVTIEIAPATKQIVQANGMQNRSATQREQEIISNWMNILKKRFA